MPGGYQPSRHLLTGEETGDECFRSRCILILLQRRIHGGINDGTAHDVPHARHVSQPRRNRRQGGPALHRHQSRVGWRHVDDRGSRKRLCGNRAPSSCPEPFFANAGPLTPRPLLHALCPGTSPRRWKPPPVADKAARKRGLVLLPTLHTPNSEGNSSSFLSDASFVAAVPITGTNGCAD
jgi:hypothetical protein